MKKKSKLIFRGPKSSEIYPPKEEEKLRLKMLADEFKMKRKGE